MKKILVLAVSAAFVTPLAMAEVSIFGSVRSAVEVSNVSGSTNPELNVSRLRLADQSSRLGFRGSDRLDSGLTVLWQAEQRIRIGGKNADGSVENNAWGQRDTFIGLQGDFGQIRFGKMDDVIDSAAADFFSAAEKIDENANGFANFARRGAAKPVSAAIYHSPSFNGFAFKAQYDFGSKKDSANNGYGYAGSAFYRSPFLDAGVAYKHVLDSNFASPNMMDIITVRDGDYYKTFIAGFNVKPRAGLQLSAAWNRVKTSTQGVEHYQDGYGVAANYAVGRMKYVLSYGRLDDVQDASVSDTGAWGVNGGVAYALSKQSSLRAGLNYIRNERNAGFYKNDGFNAVGTDTFIPAGANSKIVAATVGMQTSF